MDEDLRPPDTGSFGPGPAPASDTGGRRIQPAGRKWSIRPGVVLALAVAAALVVFIVQNGSQVPVKWWFVEVDGPLWAVIIVAAVAGALLSEVVGWVVGRRRRRRRR